VRRSIQDKVDLGSYPGPYDDHVGDGLFDHLVGAAKQRDGEREALAAL